MLDFVVFPGHFGRPHQAAEAGERHGRHDLRHHRCLPVASDHDGLLDDAGRRGFNFTNKNIIPVMSNQCSLH